MFQDIFKKKKIQALIGISNQVIPDHNRKNIAQLIEQYWRVKFQYYRMYRIFKHNLCHALGVIHTQKKAIKGLGPRLIEFGPSGQRQGLCY